MSLTALCVCKANSAVTENSALCSFKTCEILFERSSLFYEYMGTHTHLLQKSYSQLLDAMWIPLAGFEVFSLGIVVGVMFFL